MARKVVFTRSSKPTTEGAGVHLRRGVGVADSDIKQFDPFLLLDDFHSDNPADYIAGFPWHPHRGIETVTYLLHGSVAHGDSLGNKGVIGPGEIQWMSAGSGIIHEEMPALKSGLLWGLQLWVNLPAAKKMSTPDYQGITADQVLEIELANGVRAKVVAGTLGGATGPVRDIAASPSYFDITIPTLARHAIPVEPDHTVFAYILEGGAGFRESGQVFGAKTVVLLGPGDTVEIAAGDSGARLLLFSGKPLGEPVAWGGPIVMNTQEELELAFEEYRQGTFIK